MLSPSGQLRVNLEEKRKQVDKLNAAHAQVKDKHNALQTSVNSSEELLQTLLTGLSSSNNGNTGGGYMGKIADSQARLATGQAEETTRMQNENAQRNKLRFYHIAKSDRHVVHQLDHRPRHPGPHHREGYHHHDCDAHVYRNRRRRHRDEYRDSDRHCAGRRDSNCHSCGDRDRDR